MSTRPDTRLNRATTTNGTGSSSAAEGSAGFSKVITDIKKDVALLKKKQRELEIQLTDVRRQTSKTVLELKGEHLPPRTPREDCAAIFIRSIQEKYGILVLKEDLAACHRSNGGSILAKFISQLEGSPYDRLLRRFNNWDPNEQIKMSIDLLPTPTDRRISFICRVLQRSGHIKSHHYGRSGKVVARVEKPQSNGQAQLESVVLNTDEDAFGLGDDGTRKTVKKKDAERRAKKSGRPNIQSANMDTSQ